MPQMGLVPASKLVGVWKRPGGDKQTPAFMPIKFTI